MKNSANTEMLDIKPETSAACGELCCFITQFKMLRKVIKK